MVNLAVTRTLALLMALIYLFSYNLLTNSSCEDHCYHFRAGKVFEGFQYLDIPVDPALEISKKFL